MLPLDTVNNDGSLKDADKLKSELAKLKAEANIDGIMSDMWWGIVQKGGIDEFNFDPYIEIAKIAESLNLTLQFVMSFHKCGGNVGDVCNIPLPDWVTAYHDQYSIFYKDAQGYENTEYLSLGIDEEPIFQNNRTSIDLYSNFLAQFKSTFSSYISSSNRVINKIELGLGPAGELRYPSYSFSAGWKYPGIGEFQCYDDFMKANLVQYAKDQGHSEWTSPPSDAGTYTSHPDDTNFFSNGYSMEYGDFFLTWYSSELIQHGKRVLDRASSIFSSTPLVLGVKVPGIHWWHGNVVGAAECTAGYHQTSSHNGYEVVGKLLSEYSNTEFQFTCLEMTDAGQKSCNCDSQPQELIEETKKVAISEYGLSYSGENALQTYSSDAFDEMLKIGSGLESITYLRLCDDLFDSQNFQNFKIFVANAHKMK